MSGLTSLARRPETLPAPPRSPARLYYGLDAEPRPCARAPMRPCRAVSQKMKPLI